MTSEGSKFDLESALRSDDHFDVLLDNQKLKEMFVDKIRKRGITIQKFAYMHGIQKRPVERWLYGTREDKGSYGRKAKHAVILLACLYVGLIVRLTIIDTES